MAKKQNKKLDQEQSVLNEMVRDVDDAIKQEKLEALWKKYGTALLSGIGAIILGTAVYVGVQSYQHTQQESQTTVMLNAMSAENAEGALLSEESRQEALEGAAQELDGSPAAMAMLQLADRQIEAGQTDDALATFDLVVKNMAADLIYRDMAAVSSLRLRLGKAEEPKGLIDEAKELSEEGRPYAFAARELLGLLYYDDGQFTQAKEIFSALSNNAEAPQTMRDRAAAVTSLIKEK